MASYDPRDAEKLHELHQPAAIPVVSRSNIESEGIWERRDRLNAQAAQRQELRNIRASQQVHDVFADRLHQRPLARPESGAVPPWRQDSGRDPRPSWAKPKPSIRMPRSMEVKPLQGYCLPQWSAVGEQRARDVKDLLPEKTKEEPVNCEATLPSSGAVINSTVKEVSETLEAPEESREEVKQLLRGDVELMDLSDELRADRDVVAAAVRLDGHALQHASEDLRGDRSLVLQAVRENGLALSHAAKELCEDEEVVLTAVQQNGMALQFTSSRFKASKPVVLAALAENPQAARFVARELLDDRDFVISATSFTRRIFEKASFRLKRDLNVVLEVVDHDPDCFLFAAWDLRCDRRSVLAVVSTSGCAIAHASPELRQDPEIFAVAVANDPMAAAAAKV